MKLNLARLGIAEKRDGTAGTACSDAGVSVPAPQMAAGTAGTGSGLAARRFRPVPARETPAGTETANNDGGVPWVPAVPARKQAMPFPELREPVYEPREWAEDFTRWALAHCVFRDGCCGGVAALHREWCEWCFLKQVVPCNLLTFRALLRSEGFTLGAGTTAGMVYGLVLKAEYLALTAPERAAKEGPTWNGNRR